MNVTIKVVLCFVVITLAVGVYCLLGLSIFGQAEAGGTFLSYAIIGIAMDAIPGITLVVIQGIITGRFQPWIGVWLTLYFIISEQLAKSQHHMALFPHL